MIIFKITRDVLLNRRFLALFIVLSVAASLFCLNMSLGVAEYEYRTSLSFNTYSTLTLVHPRDESASTDYVAHLQGTQGYSVGSALYITKLGDAEYVIGWDGSDSFDFWWGCLNVTRFSEADLSGGRKVAFVSEYLYSRLEDRTSLKLGNSEFEIIGYSMIVPANLLAGMDSSAQDVISAEDYRIDVTVVPYRAYAEEGYTPDMIRIKVDNITEKQRGALVREIREEFCGDAIYLPVASSDEYRAEKLVKYGLPAVFFAIVIWLGFLNLIFEWLDSIGRLTYVYRICGLSHGKITLIALIALFVLFTSGEGIALLLQWLLLPVLSPLDVRCLPSLGLILISFGMLYALTAFVSLFKIPKLEIEGGGN